MKMKFRSKMLIPTLTIIVTCILALQIIIYYRSSQVLEQEIFHAISRDADAIARNINNWYKSRIVDIKTWAQLPQVNDLFKTTNKRSVKQANDFLNLIKQDYTYYDLLFITDKNGKVIAATTDRIANLDLSKRAYFKNIRSTQKVVISKPIISKLTGSQVSVLASPIMRDGEFVGMLTGSIKLDTLKELFTSSVKIGKTGYACVCTADGTVILHPNAELELKVNMTQYDVGKYMVEKKTGTKKYWWAKESTYKGLAFHEVPLTGWIVSVTCPLSELLANLAVIRVYAIIGGVLVVALVGFYLNFLISGVAKLINALVSQLKEIAVGDIRKDVNNDYLKRSDEFGEMANSFQNMIESQRQRSLVAEEIAEGNLSHNIEVLSDNDSLGKALRKMNQKLNEIIAQISNASYQVSTGSGEMADASQALSQGATEQAASLEEISSSISEIASQSRANAENASQANILSAGARDEAEKGSEDVQEMLHAMDDINKSSQEIAKIIKAIDDIAFQTNILALNAAVEAARAGVHGKGFAVVADEVRTLAGRSAKAASETADLIDKALHNAEHGQNVAERTSNSFKNIVDSIVKFTDITSEIAAASNEQATGVSQINTGLSQVDQVTQTNTANAEETASVAEQLASQAKLMSELLTYFKLQHATSNQSEHSSQQSVDLPPAALTPPVTIENSSQPASAQNWGNASPKKEQDYDSVISLESNDLGRY